ncbi:MAG: YutD family protein [Limosilactobacillus sp.]|nr:YutD family protein [Limosilactobacillus sp.]
MKRDQVQAYIDQRAAQRAGIYRVEMQDATHLLINGHQYELVQEYRDGFEAEKLADRFSSVLTKYDYIVGDWGHTQLRLRGFFAPDNPLYEPMKGMELIPQYLQEECNFGCAFFILRNHEVVLPRSHRANPRNNATTTKRGQRHFGRRATKGSFVEKRRRQNRPKPQQRRHQEVKTVTDQKQPSKRKFVIRDKKRGN